MYRKKKQIPAYKVGEQVDDLFVVRFKKPVRQSKNGNYWFELKLQDAFGDIMLKYWGGTDKRKVDSLYNSISHDAVIRVIGVINEYNGKKEINVDESGNIVPLRLGEFELTDFIRYSKKDPDLMLDELLDIIKSISNPHILKLVNSFFSDKNFLDKFKQCPGAMYKHHGWVHGLLEHTLTVTKISIDIAKYHPELDRDLVIAGAVLHDIGKIKELETTTTIKVTDHGNLIGHLTLGVQMATLKFEKVDVPEVLKQKIIHMILSHHNYVEYGSPKQPSFPEALVVAKADEMDALVTQMIDLKENAQTEDSFYYSKDFGNIYLK